MKIKVSEATPKQIDWMVATAEGKYSVSIDTDTDGTKRVNYGGMYPEWSTDWAQAGPIIEREKLDVLYMGDGMSEHYWRVEDIGGYTHAEGPTPLIAAMRSYVVSKLGEEVEVPDELAS